MSESAAPRDYADVQSIREQAGGRGHKHRGCPDCGALVFDTDQHDEWHDEQQKVAEAADRADGRTRRIG